MSDISEIKRLAHQLRTVADNIPNRGKSGLKNVIPSLVMALQANSPVHTGKFRSGWGVRPLLGGGKGHVAGFVIFNRTPNYGYFIDFGSEKGQRPWPEAISPPKGSTVEYKGRIYPAIAPGGPIEITFNNFNFDAFTQRMSDALLGGLHG